MYCVHERSKPSTIGGNQQTRPGLFRFRWSEDVGDKTALHRFSQIADHWRGMTESAQRAQFLVFPSPLQTNLTKVHVSLVSCYCRPTGGHHWSSRARRPMDANHRPSYGDRRPTGDDRRSFGDGWTKGDNLRPFGDRRETGDDPRSFGDGWDEG